MKIVVMNLLGGVFSEFNGKSGLNSSDITVIVAAITGIAPNDQEH